jgi:hypothetical protein
MQERGERGPLEWFGHAFPTQMDIELNAVVHYIATVAFAIGRSFVGGLLHGICPKNQ